MVGIGIKTINTLSKHRAPRFVYHLTNKSHYNQIMKSGELRPSKDMFCGEAVFMADLINYFKRWKTKPTGFDESLQQRLINQVKKGQDDLVVLRIPTAKLDSDKLFLRGQNICFDWVDKNEKKIDYLSDEVLANYGGVFKEENETAMLTDLRELLKKKFKGDKNAEHMMEGVSAKFSKYFKQKKEPIEYLYKDNISADNIEKIGEINLSDLYCSYKYDQNKPIRSIFTALLKDAPELKGAELLNC